MDRVKYAVWLTLFAGCSFSHGVVASQNGGDDAPTDTPDVIDAPPDTPPVDAMIDAPKTCPSDYVAIANGQSTSRYKLYSSASAANIVDQNTAKTVCHNGGGYLAIPDNATEMSAFDAIPQNQSQPGYWVGLTDAATEGTWLTVLGGAAPYLPWRAGNPNGGAMANCAVGYNGELYDVDCAMATYVFICECSLN